MDDGAGAVVKSAFRPPWWLRNPHLQTLWVSLVRRGPRPPLRWEVFTLDDGDFVEVAWVDRPVPRDAPTVLFIHGLTGSVESVQIRSLLQVMSDQGWRAGCFHFRGSGRGPNRTPLGYHSGMSEDPRAILRRLRQRHSSPLAAVGISLGANVLLKLLGEDGDDAPVDAAVALSAPLVLRLCVDRMERGFSSVYQHHLLRRLVQQVKSRPVPISPAELEACRTFRDFDNLVTAPIHGFESAEDYYARSSCRPFLPGIRRPTLIIHAEDDPFFQPGVVPSPAELPASVCFELAAHGGHVGFVEGVGRYYCDSRVPAWLSETLMG